jgi:hypothetical protein
MKKVFLSYAKEDQGVAVRLVQSLTNNGMTVLWWQDDKQRGARFVERIENEIATADFFIALMSPEYLSSGWCRRERDLAVQRETGATGKFVYIAEVVRTEHFETGFLSSYDWLDLTQPVDDAKLHGVVKAVSGTDVVPKTGSGPKMQFRNRNDELNIINSALRVTGGNDLWLVVSPPRLGKSWFLDQLQWRLRDKFSAPRLIDLREHPLDLRYEPVLLLRELFALDENVLPRTADLSNLTVRTAIAAAIAMRRTNQLYLLDSADLLDEKCAIQFRRVLTAIYRLVKDAGTGDTRLSVVVGSRRDDPWRGLSPGGGPDTRFQSINLTEFSFEVVYQALAEHSEQHGQHLSDKLLRDCATRLLRLSEGLPALLIRGLRWAERAAFIGMDQSDHQTTFDEVAGPYIREDLLSVNSLLPCGGRNLGETRKLLEQALRVLVVYRLFTLSHLRKYVERDPGLQQALNASGTHLDDLWTELGQTALLKRPSVEIWRIIHPPIRRLLYRYFYGTDNERIEAHSAARKFYEAWTERDAGLEQPVMLVECLWHEVTLLAVRGDRDIAGALPGITVSLAGEFAKSPMYDPIEFTDYVKRLLTNDEEFQIMLQEHDGLFEEILESVVTTISGGP